MLIPVPDTAITRILLAACLFLTLPASVDAARDDVLVVVNDNSIDSPLVGAYYAEQRDIAPDNIVHVNVPNSPFITWDEFRSLRDQIIRFMQQNTLDDPALNPLPCADGDPPYYCQASMEQLRAHTRIRYLVMTRGVPTRMTVDGSTLYAAAAPTSVDNYLSYWLANYFAEDVAHSFTEREVVFDDGRGMRTVIPAKDRELIVGRIDGLNLDLAKALVDRARQAERDGLYGKLYGSTKFGRWLNHSTDQRVYPDWHYQLGVFGEPRPECVDYLNYAGTLPEGKAPAHCLVRLNEGVDNRNPAPGNAASRAPLADDALVYQGWVDGQSAVGSFTGLLNWRRNDQCSSTLCKDSADPAACRAASTDVFQEINTDCVGVAEGFIGYNHQSYPLSFLTLWPTGWYQTTNNTSWTSKGGGDVFALGFPEVRNDMGFDDSHSLWFRNLDQVPAPGCYPDSDFSKPPSEACVDSRRVILAQKIPLVAQALDTSKPPTYRLAVRYKAANIDTSTPVRVRFFVHESGGGSNQIDYGTQTLATLPAGDTDWTLAATQFQLDPTLHTAPSYDGIKIRIETANQFAGELGFDTISVQAAGQPVELIENGSFTRGFEQVASGDHAAVFLNRLNGVAFWGSVSHHQSGGCAFCFNGLEQLVYFFRGLPLGDAVWFNHSYNSGILYGDPLYSPVAVRLNPVNANDTVSGLVKLHGSAVNGRDPARVSTTYAIDYCEGEDFFVCDQASTAWQSTGIRGQGGAANTVLGTWDATGVLPGQYTLRLAVTSTHALNGKTQSFYDYYPVTVQAADQATAGSLGFTTTNYTVNESAGQATITVARSGGSAGMASVDYATSNGSASQGIDYTTTSGTLMFASAEISKTFTIPLLDDNALEGNETVTLTLGNVKGGATFAAMSSAVLTILENDQAPDNNGDRPPDAEGFAPGLDSNDPAGDTDIKGGGDIVDIGSALNNPLDSDVDTAATASELPRGGGGGCALSTSSIHRDPTFLLFLLVSLGSLLRHRFAAIRCKYVGFLKLVDKPCELS